MEDNPIYTLLGAVVEQSVAQRFKERIGNADPDEVLGTFIEMVADGYIVIRGNKNEKEVCDTTKEMHSMPQKV